MRYRTTIPLPLSSVERDEVIEVASLGGSVRLEIAFDDGLDLWELAKLCQRLEADLSEALGDDVEIPRPKEVEE